MCYFKNKEIRIASLVLEKGYHSKIMHSKMHDPHWKEVSEWKNIIFNLRDANMILDADEGG